LKFESLFQPVRIGKVEIKNRIAMSPMGTAFSVFIAHDGGITQRAIDYYQERAQGGVGLIIAGHTRVTDMEPLPLPIINNSSVTSFAEMAEAVHYYGTKVFVQLSPGFGRVRFAAWGGKPFSASEVPCYWQPDVMTRALAVQEIEGIVKAMGNAARLLKEAGIDGVEIHGHEGYLLDQFSTAVWNKRNDKYGGELEERLTFAIEILNEIKGRAGIDFPVDFRFGLKHYMKGPRIGALPGEDFVEAGRDVAEGLEMAGLLEKAGYDALHVDAGCYDSWYWSHPPGYQPHGCLVDMAEKAKKAVKIPVIAVGRLDLPELANQVVKDGKADMIAIGRGLLADPYWPKKVRAGDVAQIRPCCGCMDACLNRAGEHKPSGCSVNPACGRERLYPLQQVDRPNRVLIAGGGLAGMEAARVSALRGCQVTLYEKATSLGGHAIAGSVPEFKKDVRRLLDWYEVQLRKSDVQIKLGKEITPEIIKKECPDKVIVATGSKPIIPDIPGIDNACVATAVDILLGKKKTGQTVVVVGGGMVGCETALFLAKQGKKVTIIEALAELATGIAHASQVMLLDMLKACRVRMMTNMTVEEVTDGHVKVIDKGLEPQIIACDTVALAVGMCPNRELYESLKSDLAETYLIGDCKEPRKIMNAIWDGFHIACK